MNIELRDVSRVYSDAGRNLEVVSHLNVVFEGGKSYGIVGRSGVGKSTLLHLLGGLDRPTSGEILFGETAIAGLKDDDLSAFRGERVGFIFQFHHLLPEFTAVENVAMPLIIRGLSEVEANRRASEVLRTVGLADRETHMPGELSGGEQQRVAIARAIVSNPQVVLADEPTGSLDVRTAAAVQELLVGLNRSLRNTLIVVTHNVELARSLDVVFEMLPGGQLTVAA